jgi:hypothetical protein
METPVFISRTVVHRVLGGATILILLGSLFYPFVFLVLERSNFVYLARVTRSLFDVDAEANVAAWFSSAILLLAALLLTAVGLAKRLAREPYARHWIGLGLVFVFLSMDETAMFHEKTIDPLRVLLRATGVLYYSWVVVGALVVFVIGLIYLKFLRDLPGPIRVRFVVAGLLFVGGALGVEMIAAYYHYTIGTAYEGSPLNVLLVHIEEGMEMAGVITFISAILLYIQRHMGNIRFALDNGRITPAITPIPAIVATQQRTTETVQT